LEGAVDRKDINPWEWSKAFGFSQAVDLEGAQRIVLCSGQAATGADGSPPTTSDMGAQVRLAFENLAAVLGKAGMTAADIVRLTIYTTDVDELFGAYGTAAEFLAPNQPAMTLIGVTRLAFPELKVEIEATAAR
jgi:enamine deaminase RidA (YjgF/YER057c/UK114 family)